VQVIRDPDRLPDALGRGAVAIGNFDGVHLGHRRIVQRLLVRARQVGGSAIVFTFDPRPVEILCPGQAPPPLSWTDRKVELLAELGAEAVIAYPTNEAFLQLDAPQFFDRVVRGLLDAQILVEGPNFFFGRDRLGVVDVLRQLCLQSQLSLEVVKPVEIDGRIVSSSRIRRLLAEGHLEQARRMLDRPYRIRGTVIRGAGRGTELGYPTANLAGTETLLPGEGIYAGRAMADGRVWPAAISLGPNPTFDEGALKIEIHLVGYEGSLYGRRLEVDFLARLRDIDRFHSVGELVAQMDRDVAMTRKIAAQQTP